MEEKEVMCRTVTEFSGNKYTTGDDVLFSLRGCQLIKGKIYVHSTNEFYICHDVNGFEGNTSPNKLGYKYSWVVELDESNVSLEPSDRLLMTHYMDNVETFSIMAYPKLMHFMQNQLPNYPLLNFKLGILDLYDRITESSDQGYIELHSKDRGKKLKIKLGRLLRKLIVQYNKVAKNSKNNPVPLNDELIEKLHNKWVSYNLGVEHEIVRGGDILKGYNSKFYCKDRKLQSCMTDRFEFLKLYTNNPKQIGLMIFYLNHEICGRCILWTCDSGITYHDRIYYSHDWIKPAIDASLAKNNLTPLPNNAAVTLEKSSHTHYPYVDSMFYGSSNENVLSNYRREKTNRQYRSATGSYNNI